MQSRDYKDIVGGVLLASGGLIFSAYAYNNYGIGTPRQMGPGMFPMALGIVLAVFGLLSAVPAVFRSGMAPEIKFWPAFFVIIAIVGFATLVRPLGLLPAIVTAVVLSSLAEQRFRPMTLVALCTVLCLLAWLALGVGFGVPVAMLRWPF